MNPDDYLLQLKSTVSSILDQMAPIRQGHRPGGKKGARWLSVDAISAKRNRRQLERLWKKSGSEIDRVKYRTACQQANLLINKSRNQHHCDRITSTGKNIRQVWTAVKDLLHVDRGRYPVRLPIGETTHLFHQNWLFTTLTKSTIFVQTLRSSWLVKILIHCRLIKGTKDHV